ncbi:MAG: VOC family protein [Bacteroidota bacterium]
MNIEHLAIWVRDLKASRAFYKKYFAARSGKLYHNPKKRFTSYFLQFDNGCRLELMHHPDRVSFLKADSKSLGLAHFAISVGSKKGVDELTQILKQDGYTIVGAPRTTGDGYYESVILDPEGNAIEITV